MGTRPPTRRRLLGLHRRERLSAPRQIEGWPLIVVRCSTAFSLRRKCDVACSVRLMIEVSKFRLADGVTQEDFLTKNADYQQRFAYQQEGLVRRTVASGLDGEWLAVSLFRSMNDARRSTTEAMTSPIAIEFNAQLNPTTLSTEYFKELPG